MSYPDDLMFDVRIAIRKDHTLPNGMLRFVCEAENNAEWASHGRSELAVSAFVLAIILASCGWPT